MLAEQVLRIGECLSERALDIIPSLEKLFASYGYGGMQKKTVKETAETVFLSFSFAGSRGKSSEGSFPTLGIIGQLGGIRSDSRRIGLVSDADGAIVALACALELARLHQKEQLLLGDVIITTHICTDAPITRREPVDFMGLPVAADTMQRYLVSPSMDALISVDTTKGNRILNHKGLAITPTVKEGYILPVSSSLIDILERTTGRPARILPLATQDITPYNNGLRHLNTIMQPATATSAPVIGLALTTETAVPGPASGASHFCDLEAAARFCLEAAQDFAEQPDLFYQKEEFAQIVNQYGELSHLCR